MNGRAARARRQERAKYQAPSSQSMNAKIDAADVPGAHMWVMTAAWRVLDPEKADRAARTKQFDAENAYLLDAENLIVLGGPGCFKCEEIYTPTLAAVPCVGSVGL
jgi:hypothetical protein